MRDVLQNVNFYKLLLAIFVPLLLLVLLLYYLNRREQ